MKFLNPLLLPWSEKLKKEKVEASESVTIEIAGGGKAFRFPYSPGSSLRYYYNLAGISHVASRKAVYDAANLEHGRCRSTYVPKKGARIVLCPPSVGMQAIM